ncbi:hypothetical protein K438DRAFT_23041 [Mycena galopus ATCC 62051]|nr:hypothetical protein K438DRAFT_23041 [Mycena galopus ATCC 62051]
MKREPGGLDWADIDKEISRQKHMNLTDSRKVDREQERTEKAQSALPIFGTLVMSNPRPISSATLASVIIPDLWHLSLGNKIYFPIHWWSNEILRKAIDYPHTFPTTPLSDKHISVLHVDKVMRELGDEDISCVTPTLWQQASHNQLQSLKQLCPSIPPSDPAFAPTYASEYEKHVAFFANQDIEMFPVWYPVEHQLRYKIFSNHTFDLHYYEMRVQTVFSSYRRLRATGFPYTSPPVRTPYTLYIEKSPPPADDANRGPAKRLRDSHDRDRRSSRDHARRDDSRDSDRRNSRDSTHRRNSGDHDRRNSWNHDRGHSRDRDRGHSRDRDRGHSGDRDRRNSKDKIDTACRPMRSYRSASPPSRPPSSSRPGSPSPTTACLICTMNTHGVVHHPPADTAFRDGTPHFALKDGTTTLRPVGSWKPICISWNVGKACECHRLHVCSLCGGAHRALARDAACRRVRNGVFLP